MWQLIFSVLSVSISILSLAVALFAARRAIRAQALQRRAPHYSESQLQSLRDSLKDQAAALETLSNRVKMSRVRNNAEHVRGSPREPDGEPDPTVDPEGWRRWQNKQLRTGKVN